MWCDYRANDIQSPRSRQKVKMSKSATKAYEIIRTAVLNGEFAPGDRLKEERLVDLCGVSRTPVREAIKRLAAENYVVMKPNQGGHVANWSNQEIEDIFKLRALCEGMAARRAAALITDTQMQTLRTQQKVIDALLADSGAFNVEDFLEANRVFHETIMDATQSEVIKQAVFRLVSPPMVYQTAQSYSRQDLLRSNAHHLELIEALEEKNGDWCDAVMQTHILAAHRRFKEIVQ